MTDLIARLRALSRAEHDDLSVADEAADEIERLRKALRRCARNDNSKYDHHQARRWDGKLPRENGGTIWLTPREIARGVLGERDLATFSDREQA